MSRKEEIASILAEWRLRSDSGEAVDPEQIVAAHPEHATALRAHFAVMHAARAKRPEVPAGVPAEIGEFKILRELGRGGMGVVYEAEQTRMRRRVALKVLTFSVTGSPQAIKRFQREARAAGRLHHTNIVPVYGMGQHAGHWYYAMELVPGRALSDVIADLRGEDEPPTAESAALLGSRGEYFARVAEMFAGVADALELAHGEGITHRDIKPSNLLLAADGMLKIVDFGLARVATDGPSMTITGDLLGTPAYMSPEQAMAKRIHLDHRTDIYSLGATLYEVLTVRPPFRGKTLQQVCTQIITKDPDLPRKINARIPRDLETIVLKAMDKDRDKRYQTGAAFARDLRLFAEGGVIHARRIGPVGRAWRKVKRHKVRASLVAAALVLAVAGAWFGGWLLRESSQRAQFEAVRDAPPSAAAQREKARAKKALAERPEPQPAEEPPPPKRKTPSKARQLASRGNGLFARRFFQRAVALYDKALAIDDTLLDVRANRGAALYELKHYRRAHEDLQYVLARREDDFHSWFNLALVLEKLDRWSDAVEAHERACKLGPNDADAQLYRSQALYAVGRLEEAVAAFDKAMAVGLADPRAIHKEARRRALASEPPVLDLASAVELAEIAVERAEREGDYWNTLGIARCRAGKWRSALEALNQSLVLREGDASDYFHIAIARWKLGRRRGARTAYEKGVEWMKNHQAGAEMRWFQVEAQAALGIEEDTPEDAHALHRRGMALTRAGRVDEAFAAFDQAIRLDPRDPRPRIQRALIYGSRKQYDKALQDLEVALRFDPDNFLAAAHKAQTLSFMGRKTDALRALERAHELDAEHPGVLNNLAWGLANTKDPEVRDLDRAIALIKEGVRLAPGSWVLHNTLGAVHYERGEWKKALEALEKAVELPRGDRAANWFYLAMARWQLGDRAEARTLFDQAAEWMRTHTPRNAELLAFRARAAKLLGVE